VSGELFTVTKDVEFDMGHRVPNHKSKCRNPHGHRYKVAVTIEGTLQREGSSEGMVEDFGDLKQVMMEKIHDPLDHGFMVYRDDFQLVAAFIHDETEEGDEESQLYPKHDWKVIVVDFVPTAENLARWCYDRLREHYPLTIRFVEVWETPTSKATYPT